MNLIIREATIIDSNSPFNNQKVDVRINAGTIEKIGSKISNENGYDEIKFENLHLSQGYFSFRLATAHLFCSALSHSRSGSRRD